MVRGVGGARHVVDEPGLFGRDLLQLLHVADRLVGHRRFEVPAGIVLEGVDRGGVAEEVRLPLARVAADEAVEVVEAHAVRPLVERTGLAGLVEGRVVVLAEPGGGVAVVAQRGADGALVERDDRIVARVAGGDLADDAEAHRVVVAPGDQRGAGRRAERGGVEVGVAQAVLRQLVHRRGRDHAAEGARRAEALVVGHDQEHVRRAFGRHHLRRPPRRRLRGLLLDHAAELGGRRGERRSAERGRRVGRARRAGDLLPQGGRGRDEERRGGRHDDIVAPRARPGLSVHEASPSRRATGIRQGSVPEEPGLRLIYVKVQRELNQRASAGTSWSPGRLRRGGRRRPRAARRGWLRGGSRMPRHRL